MSLPQAAPQKGLFSQVRGTLSIGAKTPTTSPGAPGGGQEKSLRRGGALAMAAVAVRCGGSAEVELGMRSRSEEAMEKRSGEVEVKRRREVMR